MHNLKILIAAEIKNALPNAIQRLEGIVETQVAKSIIQSQALYYPAPKPVYAAHELHDIADIQPHPSRDPAMKAALGAKWRGFSCPEQAIALEKMLMRTTNVIYIGACGTGKTFLILSAAKVFGQSRTTIVILPHSGLHLDFIRRADEMQVSWSKWEPNGDYNPNAQIIWAVVEHIEVAKFKMYVFDIEFPAYTHCSKPVSVPIVLQAGALIDFSSTCFIAFSRIAIIAKSFTLSHLWRTTGRRYSLRQPDTQQLSGIKTWDVIRMSVARKNIALQCFEYKDEEDLLEALVDRVAEQLESFGDDDRMMIFTQRVEQAETIANLLGIQAFHAKLDDKSKSTIFHDWRAGMIADKTSCQAANLIKTFQNSGFGMNIGMVYR